MQTTENFKHLCIGDKTNKDGRKLAYAGSAFHRCIKGYVSCLTASKPISFGSAQCRVV
jgi:cyclophilin family peptidyl-prolyl cis-trans isomerase